MDDLGMFRAGSSEHECSPFQYHRRNDPRHDKHRDDADGEAAIGSQLKPGELDVQGIDGDIFGGHDAPLSKRESVRTQGL
jgi:hypothetical protein